MGDPVLLKTILQGPDNCFLADNLAEKAWS
jgi:hypothetical protein